MLRLRGPFVAPVFVPPRRPRRADRHLGLVQSPRRAGGRAARQVEPDGRTALRGPALSDGVRLRRVDPGLGLVRGERRRRQRDRARRCRRGSAGGAPLEHSGHALPSRPRRPTAACGGRRGERQGDRARGSRDVREDHVGGRLSQRRVSAPERGSDVHSSRRWAVRRPGAGDVARPPRRRRSARDRQRSPVGRVGAPRAFRGRGVA